MLLPHGITNAPRRILPVKGDMENGFTGTSDWFFDAVGKAARCDDSIFVYDGGGKERCRTAGENRKLKG